MVLEESALQRHEPHIVPAALPAACATHTRMHTHCTHATHIHTHIYHTHTTHTMETQENTSVEISKGYVGSKSCTIKT